MATTFFNLNNELASANNELILQTIQKADLVPGN